jgi:sugar lactone lactonase YvrE
MSRSLNVLFEGGSFFEGPRWRDGRWWVSDFYMHLVRAIDPDGRAEEALTVEGQPSGLGWLPDGSLLVVSMRDRRVLRRSADGEVSLHADVSEHCGGHLNDMVVDSQGRAYAGNFGFDLMGGGDPATANLIRIDPDGSSSVVAEEMVFPNGSVITPDGRTLIVGETAGARYTAFDIEPDGSLSGRRTWAQIGPAPEIGPLAEMLATLEFEPDGCCLDAEGQIWAADAAGGSCKRVAEGGTVTDEITLPDGMLAFACMLGGDDGRTLLICGAPDFLEHNRAGSREAVLFTTTVEVPHAGLP